MAIPVKFADIGKSAKDLLKADYSPFSLEVNSQTVNGVKFTSSAKKNEKGAVSGELKAKYTDAAHGVTFNYTFTTAKTLKAKAEVADSLVKGLRLDAEATIEAEKTPGVKFGLGFKQPHINCNASVGPFAGEVPVTVDAVVSHSGFNLGGEVTLDKLQLKGFNLGASYTQPDYSFSVLAKPESQGKSDISLITASYYHQISSQVAAGAEVTYNLAPGKASTEGKAESKPAALAIGTQYALDSTSSIKTVLATNSSLLLQYTQRLRPNLKATFGTSLKWSEGPITADTGLSLILDA